MADLFSKKHLLEALKEARLPYTYKALLKYERLGVIPASARIDGRVRVYTQEEIDAIVEKMRTYKNL